MDKQDPNTHEEQEKIRLANFLDRLKIIPNPKRQTIRIWLACAGVIMFVLLVILYYVFNGG